MKNYHIGSMRKDKLLMPQTPAKWTDLTCPICLYSLVAVDKFGVFCCIGNCDWQDDFIYFMKYCLRNMWE